MSVRSQFAWSLMLVAVASAAQSPAGRRVRSAPASVAAAPKPTAPAGALPALPLDQIPSSSPRVDYQNSQLTIVARNSTLGDILREVQSRTGAAIEVPLNSTERVVGLFGPGQPRDVLASLLNGSHFNYVLLGSPASPNVLERVILIAKTGPDEVSPTESTDAKGGAVQAGQDMSEDSTDETADEPQNDAAPDGDEAQPDRNNSPAVKTPQQLLQELQRQQLLQQGQPQGNQPAPVPGAPNLP